MHNLFLDFPAYLNKAKNFTTNSLFLEILILLLVLLLSTKFVTVLERKLTGQKNCLNIKRYAAKQFHCFAAYKCLVCMTFGSPLRLEYQGGCCLSEEKSPADWD
jgi:hypothetical protein